MLWLLLPLVVFATVATGASAQEAGRSTALTVYSTAEPGAISPDLYRPLPQSTDVPSRFSQSVPGYAIVKQERDMNLEKGRSTLRFTDVAAQIDPTTVRFSSTTDPEGTRVLEQNYQFDLVSNDRLMERYIDQPITVEQTHGDSVSTISGTLISTSGGLIVKSASGEVQILNSYSNVRLPELPGGLITKPTLVWDLAADKGGAQKVRVTYETGGMTWWADYNLVFAEGKNANSGTLDVGAWVSLLNQSGAGYADAKLKLVAGNVHRAPRAEPMVDRRAVSRLAMMGKESSGFEEKSFFEYHLYTLGRSTTLPDNSTKQIELFPAVRGVPCEKVLVYYGLLQGFRGFFGDPVTDRDFGTQSNKQVDIYLRFKNSKDRGMGMPLPAGRIRVSKLDPTDGTLEFIGEDKLDHTPKDEPVLIKMGTAFDVVGERRQTDFKVDTAHKQLEEEFEIKVRNHKDEPVTVLVKENLFRWSTWEIVQKSQDFEKVDARTVQFPVEIKKDGEATVTYRARYTW
ncbi:MAG: DUF4139 domain-containing protein [Deltaproteobacteria bacterium]|nr:DUF4139 domain-containing protein [Deltaproteobacteria bacterium]